MLDTLIIELVNSLKEIKILKTKKVIRIIDRGEKGIYIAKPPTLNSMFKANLYHTI